MAALNDDTPCSLQFGMDEDDEEHLYQWCGRVKKLITRGAYGVNPEMVGKCALCGRQLAKDEWQKRKEEAAKLKAQEAAEVMKTGLVVETRPDTSPDLLARLDRIEERLGKVIEGAVDNTPVSPQRAEELDFKKPVCYCPEVGKRLNWGKLGMYEFCPGCLSPVIPAGNKRNDVDYICTWKKPEAPPVEQAHFLKCRVVCTLKPTPAAHLVPFTNPQVCSCGASTHTDSLGMIICDSKPVKRLTVTDLIKALPAEDLPKLKDESENIVKVDLPPAVASPAVESISGVASKVMDSMTTEKKKTFGCKNFWIKNPEGGWHRVGFCHCSGRVETRSLLYSPTYKYYGQCFHCAGRLIDDPLDHPEETPSPKPLTKGQFLQPLIPNSGRAIWGMDISFDRTKKMVVVRGVCSCGNTFEERQERLTFLALRYSIKHWSEEMTNRQCTCGAVFTKY